MRKALRAGLAVTAILAMTGCGDRAQQGSGGTVTKEPRAPRPEVIIFAAASMQPALDGLLKACEGVTGAKVNASYASSAVLVQQIQRGAPADVLISADPAWAATLEAAGRSSKHVEFLGNSLVVVVPLKSGDAVKNPEDLAGGAIKHIAIGDPASVPAGKYAKEALQALGLWDKLQAKFVPASDVRQALVYVERGEAEAGVVYATDAKSSKAVRVVTALDASLKTPVRYALVLVKRDGLSTHAATCFDFLQSDTAMRGFEAAGFQRLPAASAASAPKK